MRGNHFGKMFSFMSFGESHGPAMGVVIDGLPAGLTIDLHQLQNELDKRRPGRVAGTTNRNEEDRAIVLSGIFEGKSLGSPIAVTIQNTNQKSSDYDQLKTEVRAGHADQTTLDKFGVRDHRGGGRASGRETVARVIAGYFAGLIIPQIKIKAFSSHLGSFVFNGIPENVHVDFGDYHFPDTTKTEAIKKYLEELKSNGESIGGAVTVVIDNCPVGLGEPAFDKLKADLAKALMSIGAVVGFSFGSGMEFLSLKGSEVSADKRHFGGMEGGISNGERIVLTVYFKPTSTVGEKAKAGRHDPCIIPRAIPVVEAMTKVVLADHFLRQRAYGDGLK